MNVFLIITLTPTKDCKFDGLYSLGKNMLCLPAFFVFHFMIVITSSIFLHEYHLKAVLQKNGVYNTDTN